MNKTPIEILADSLLATAGDDEAPDLLDAFVATESLLDRKNFLALAAALDLCPFHHCDLEICDDDERDCRDKMAETPETTDEPMWVVVTVTDGEVADTEILDAEPEWGADEIPVGTFQIVSAGYVNGGDTSRERVIVGEQD
jgi:hypothetical protein